MKHKLEILDLLQRHLPERMVDRIEEKDPGLAEVEIEFDVKLDDEDAPICSITTDEVAGMILKRVLPGIPDTKVTGSLVKKIWDVIETHEWEWRADHFRELQEEGATE